MLLAAALALVAVPALASAPDVDSPPTTNTRSRKDSALIVSIEDYTFLADATGATKDADVLQIWLSKTRGVERITRATDPDKAAFKKKLDEAIKGVRKGGMLWVYFAGHGAVDAEGRRTLMTKESANDDIQGLFLDDIRAKVVDSRAKTTLVVLDAGFGGVGRGGEPLGLPDHGAVPALAPPSSDSVVYWSATTAGESAPTYPETGHGMFTYFVAGALEGWADGATGGKPNGEVTLEEAQVYVTKNTRIVGGKLWNPTRDSRDSVTKWVLARGNLVEGPSKEDLAAMAQSEKMRRVSEATAIMLAAADGEWMEIAVTTAVASPEGIAKLNGFVQKYELATVGVDGVAVAVVVPQVVDARARLDAFARDELKAKGKKKRKRGTKKKAAPPPPPVSTTAACDDLVKLEPLAIIGTLTPDHAMCLETKITLSTKQTERDKVSRVLMANADGKGDADEWMRLASRHLEDIDRSDPDICFRYALTLSRTGTLEDGEEVMHWIDYALENKQVWEGPTYMARVYNLQRLRAETATRLWIDAEADYQDERSDETSALAEEFRGRAKNTAREWLDYARASSQSVDRAYSLCQAAAGSPNFCTETAPKPAE